ncbi:hypothetical protein SGCOL_006962 [Colletotrichum sp. CLE4]
MNSNRVWGDSPVVHPISGPDTDRYQPESSQAAMARFNRMCMDNESIISKAATWGTRRRSLPSVIDMDTENVTSGNLLKKLSISRGEGGRRPSILKDLRGLVRRPSASHLLKRSRSTNGENAPKSEAPPPMEKRGPPVAVLAKGNSTNVDPDEDDDDEDDLYEDGDMNAESSKLIQDVSPNFAGFQTHVLRLNPDLASTNNYLVDRIAHQQVVRYKSLLNAKVKHLGIGQACSCGSFCLARGGRPVLLDHRGDSRDIDPLSTGADSGDGDSTPMEGAITKDSFPQDIPMPPTQSLPAEFECQLCFTLKKPKKPSDWTKHVHEDVQPFTCTWDRCRDPKIFKRKADWHLVREHKFVEPKNKTKAAIKRAGGIDPTWQKVEQCRHETTKRPQEEPCRFCGKQFPTWKKLTVHLAKHMEHISLPILRLVAAKELEPDTIISPVQDPPPRAPFNAPTPLDESVVKSEHSLHSYGNQSSYQPNAMMANSNGLYQNVNPLGYSGVAGNSQFPDYMYSSQYSNTTQPMAQNLMGMQPVNRGTQGFNQQYQNPSNVAVPAASYMGAQQQYMSLAQETEPFPALDHNALGLHQPGQMGVGMAYDGLMGQSNIDENQYNYQGSISPYSHSPLQGGSGFYPP